MHHSYLLSTHAAAEADAGDASAPGASPRSNPAVMSGLRQVMLLLDPCTRCFARVLAQAAVSS